MAKTQQDSPVRTRTLIGTRRKKLLDQETGEIIEVDQITKRVQGQKAFWKVYFVDFLQIVGLLDSKQIEVLAYILESTKSSDNTYIGTYRGTAAGAGVATETVRKAMKKLIEGNFIRKIQNGVYQVSPHLMTKGNEYKKHLLLSYFTDDPEPAEEDAQREASEVLEVVNA